MAIRFVVFAVLAAMLAACGGSRSTIPPVPKPNALPTEIITTEHVTASGTPYTVHTAIFDHDTVTFGIANRNQGQAPVPLLLYTHGARGDATQFAELAAWSGLRDWLMDHGWAWVEALGGGPYSWGNEAARASYEEAFIWVYSKLHIGKVVILGRSMGGLVASWLATRSTLVAPRTSGLILNSGVTDLGYWYTSGDEKSRKQLRSAFGVSEMSENAFTEATREFDPMRMPAETWKGINVLQLVGTDDAVVPASRNAFALRERWAGEPTLDLLDIRQGGDHSSKNGSYLQLDAMTQFLEKVVSSENR